MHCSVSRQRHFRASCALILVYLTFSLLSEPLLAQPAGASKETRIHYSLYYENYKSKNYKDALPNLIWILENAPGFPRNKDTNFDRAVTVYESLAEQEEDETKKAEFLNEAVALHDKAIEAIQSIEGEIDVFEWTRDKGRFIQKHLDFLGEHKEEAVASYRKAYDIDSKRIDPYYLDVIIGDMYAQDNIGGALDFLRELKDLRGEEEGVENLIRKYFAVVPPDEQIVFLEEQLAASPDDITVIQQLFELYEQEGYHEEMMALAPKILALDPTPGVLRMLTRMYLEDGGIDEAIAVFNQMKESPEVELKAQDYHNMGIAQQELEKYADARSYYQQAVEVDPDYRAASRAIADLYATAVVRCGVKDREQAAVFWLIADAYSRAGDAAGAARMRSAFPTAEDVFYVQRWTNGESTSVSYSCLGLTISGTTTVRQR